MIDLPPLHTHAHVHTHTPLPVSSTQGHDLAHVQMQGEGGVNKVLGQSPSPRVPHVPLEVDAQTLGRMAKAQVLQEGPLCVAFSSLRPDSDRLPNCTYIRYVSCICSVQSELCIPRYGMAVIGEDFSH